MCFYLPLAIRRQGPQLQSPLLLAGKLIARGSLNAVAPGDLIYINDDISKRRFLVDTGAAFSIFPHRFSASSSGPRLFNVKGLPIKCWGEQPMTLCFGGRRFAWTFLLSDVQFPIIGVDFS